MRYGYIYKTTNLINGRLYIGQKKGTFKPSYLGSGIILCQAIDKYGRKNFKLEVLDFATTKEMLAGLEQKYIYEYRQVFGRDFLYNITKGGLGNTLPRTEAQKKRLSEVQMGTKKPATTIALKGKKHNYFCVCGFCKGLSGNKNPMWRGYSDKLTRDILIQRYVIEKKNAREIAIMEACSETTVKRLLRKFGLMRSKSEALKGIKHRKELVHGE